jgi:hypothetical protein
VVSSTLYSHLGLVNFLVPSFIRRKNRGCMKLSVAPLSTRHRRSALLYLVCTEIGTFIERKRSTYTELQQSALTQAVGFRHPENPRSSTSSGGSCFSPPRFLLLLLTARRWLVRGGWFLPLPWRGSSPAMSQGISSLYWHVPGCSSD